MERTMDGEGDAMTHRERRGWRLAAVVTVQSVLVAACLAVTIHVYWREQQRDEDGGGDIYIDFDPISGISHNGTLKFNGYRSKKVDLANNNKSRIYINCTGPYILHMEVCYEGLDDLEGNGNLELMVVGRKAALSNFALQAKEDVCRGLHSTVYLRKEEEAILCFSSPGHLMIKNVTLGLNYLRGQHCLF